MMAILTFAHSPQLSQLPAFTSCANFPLERHAVWTNLNDTTTELPRFKQRAHGHQRCQGWSKFSMIQTPKCHVIHDSIWIKWITLTLKTAIFQTGKSTNSMGHAFNSYVSHYHRVMWVWHGLSKWGPGEPHKHCNRLLQHQAAAQACIHLVPHQAGVHPVRFAVWHLAIWRLHHLKHLSHRLHSTHCKRLNAFPELLCPEHSCQSSMTKRGQLPSKSMKTLSQHQVKESLISMQLDCQNLINLPSGYD